MNIVEAYTKFNKQNIILVSGFSGSGKSKLGKFLANRFSFKLSALSDFYYSEETYDKPENYVELKTGAKVLDWDNIYRSVNWDSLNDHVEIHKSKGIVLIGFGFPKQKLKFDPDFHLHVKISKKNLIENRNRYLESHPEAPGNRYKGTQIEAQYLNQVTFPHYLKITEESKIDKYINANEKNEEEINDDAFGYMMFMIGKWIGEYNKKIVANRQFTKDKPYDGRKNLNYMGRPATYDEFFYGKQRKLYDFNNEGIDYPEEYRERYGEESSTDTDKDISEEEATFLFTAAS